MAEEPLNVEDLSTEPKEGDSTITTSSIKNEEQETNTDDNASASENKVLTEKPSAVSSETKQIQTKSKVDILLRATGNAPIMRTRKWAVESDRTVGSIIEFVKKYLKLDPSESLFLYVNQSFAPSPDQIILNLFECFGSDGGDRDLKKGNIKKQIRMLEGHFEKARPP